MASSANIVNFVRSLSDASSGLIANSAGTRGNVRSTAIAFELLELLGEEKEVAKSLGAPLQQYLSSHATSDGASKLFNFSEEGLDLAASAYYGISLGKQVGFNFGDVPAWTSPIVARQAPRTAGPNEIGAFYGDADSLNFTPESTYYSVAALSELGIGHVEEIDVPALRYFVGRVAVDLATSALTHSAIALTSAYRDCFELRVNFDTLDGPALNGRRVIQGTQFRASLAVLSFGQFAHPGMDAEIAVSFAGKGAQRAKLTFDPNSRRYGAPDYIQTADELGEVKIAFSLGQYVVGLGDLSIDASDALQVGYDISVKADAHHEVTDRDVFEGDTVSIGTSFRFGVALRTASKEFFVQGDFDMSFSVLDSTGVTVYNKVIDCSDRTDAIEFEYLLEDQNLPNGELTFSFDVRDRSGVVHTSKQVSYQLSVQMIASNIRFIGVDGDEPTFKLGDTVSVSIDPAAFPDLRTARPFAATDFSGKNIADQRVFMLDASTPSGVVLDSVKGTASGSGYTFKLPIQATLHATGTTIISFRYVSKSGESTVLSNFDSQSGELYEDEQALKYTVKTDLQMTEVVEAPTATTFSYGDSVNFQFKIVDKVSGKYVSSSEHAKVSMVLKHRDEERGKTFTSARQDAVVTNDELLINWQINPNAIAGAGIITLVTTDADGEESPLVDAISKNPVEYLVQIGGQIDVEQTSFTWNEYFSKATAFIADFTLLCNGNRLRDAKLSAVVEYASDGKKFSEALKVPVANGRDGQYSISWTTAHQDSPSGTYRVNVFRETDRQRAIEKAQWRAKQQRDAGGAMEINEEDIDIEPLLSVSFQHSQAKQLSLPIKMEVIVLALALFAFYLTTNAWKKYEQS